MRASLDRSFWVHESCGTASTVHRLTGITHHSGVVQSMLTRGRVVVIIMPVSMVATLPQCKATSSKWNHFHLFQGCLLLKFVMTSRPLLAVVAWWVSHVFNWKSPPNHDNCPKILLDDRPLTTQLLDSLAVKCSTRRSGTMQLSSATSLFLLTIILGQVACDTWITLWNKSDVNIKIKCFRETSKKRKSFKTKTIEPDDRYDIKG